MWQRITDWLGGSVDGGGASEGSPAEERERHRPRPGSRQTVVVLWGLVGVGLAVLVVAAWIVEPTIQSEIAVTPHPAPAPPATAPPQPPASDGSDLSSCLDGTCEVLIEEPLAIPLDARYGVANLRVETVGPHTVTIAMEMTRAGRASTSCVDNPPTGCRSGSLSISGGGESEPSTVSVVDAQTGARATLPALTVDVVRVEPGGAVLRLAPPAAVDGADLATCRDGTCDVRITGPAVIPLDPQFGVPDGIRVQSIVGETVTLSAAPANAEDVSIGCGPQDFETCPTTYRDGVVESTLVLGGELAFPRVWVQVAAIDGEGVVLRLQPEE